MPELLRDDPDIDALGTQFGGVGVAESMGMHALGDPGLASQAGEEDADIAVCKGATIEHTVILPEHQILPLEVTQNEIRPLVL